MARITIQDSLSQVDNHFQLIHFAAYRARQLQHGALPMVDPKEDKPTVIALREIAAGFKPADFDKHIEEHGYGVENQ